MALALAEKTYESSVIPKKKTPVRRQSVSQKMKHINKSAFINRRQELEFLKDWIAEDPKNLLFIYGPKSSGKTTLLYHLIGQVLDRKKYEIKYLNLRKVLIVSHNTTCKAGGLRKAPKRG